MSKPKGKDPAFLLYTSDFLTGTYFMTDEQVGLYIRLLCLQHQKDGRIDAGAMRAQCRRISDGDAVMAKFQQDERGYYNARLEKEINLRAQKNTQTSENARVAALSRWNPKHMQTHCDSNADAMRSEDEDEDRDADRNQEIGGVGERGLAVVKKETGLSHQSEYDRYIDLFNRARGSNFRGDKKSRQQFNARMKEGVKVEEMITALTNAMRNDHHRNNGYQYLTPEFFTRPDKIEMHLNATAPATDPNRKVFGTTTVSDIQQNAAKFAKLINPQNT